MIESKPRGKASMFGNKGERLADEFYYFRDHKGELIKTTFLMDMGHVTEKTIFKDIDILGRVGLKIEHKIGYYGGYIAHYVPDPRSLVLSEVEIEVWDKNRDGMNAEIIKSYERMLRELLVVHLMNAG